MKARVVVLRSELFVEHQHDDASRAFLAYLPAFPNDLKGEGPTRAAAVDALLTALQAKLLEPAGPAAEWERHLKPTVILREMNEHHARRKKAAKKAKG